MTTQSADSHSATTAGKGRLKIVLALTSVYLVAEVIGGVLTGSLALLADAGHMLTDVAGLGMALIAIRFSARPATQQKTFGYLRGEILAALANSIVLIGISLYILYEAYSRFRNPPEVASAAMLGVAAIGLAVNIAGILILRSDAQKSLNMKGAYFEVLSDFLTSIGVIIAGVIMLTTGWYYADPLISAGIGLFILPRTWSLLKEAVGVLLEGVPRDVDLGALRNELACTPDVQSVHDLHAWAITSGTNALSVHVVTQGATKNEDLLRELHRRARKFNIVHATIQLEPPGWEQTETHL